jgi:tetratricopeptide (TPR) repeat protein
MTEQARELVKRGQNDKALARYYKSLKLAQQLAKKDPADFRPVHQQGIIWRDLGGMYLIAADYQRAIEALDECEQICDELKGRYGVDSGRLLAGVRVERSMVLVQVGHGASAVLTMDAALNDYQVALAGQSKEMSLVLFPALVSNAVVLHVRGDPHLAVASANRGWRGYLACRDAQNWDVGAMEQAGMGASHVLAISGRLADALEADKAVIEALEASGSPGHRQRLATALATTALHLQATGREDYREEAAACLARSHALDTTAAGDAAAEWESAKSAEQPVTLAAALDTAAKLLHREQLPTGLPATFTSPPDTVVSPSGRCSLELAPRYAAQLASAATALLPVARREGLRLALEAHYLFAIAFRYDPKAPQLDSGLRWARLVVECCRILTVAPDDLPLQADLALQNLGLIEKLLPMVPGHSSATSTGHVVASDVLRGCLTQHADLLIEASQPDLARRFTQTAATIGSTQ